MRRGVSLEMKSGEIYQDCIMLCLVKHGKMLDFSLIGSPERVG